MRPISLLSPKTPITAFPSEITAATLITRLHLETLGNLEEAQDETHSATEQEEDPEAVDILEEEVTEGNSLG